MASTGAPPGTMRAYVGTPAGPERRRENCFASRLERLLPMDFRASADLY
jgi:hypothetical protein